MAALASLGTLCLAACCRSWLCRPVVEHLCCEAYKIAHGDGRLALRAWIYGIASVCRFSGNMRFEYDRIPYADLLASVYHLFE